MYEANTACGLALSSFYSWKHIQPGSSSDNLAYHKPAPEPAGML
jgi:hypothetical protein